MDSVVKAHLPTPPLYDFLYDANGNMTERTDHTAGTTYTQDFDIENRLITVINNITTTVTTLDYDDSGQRTEKIVELDQVKRTVTHYPFPTYEREVRRVWGYLL